MHFGVLGPLTVHDATGNAISVSAHKCRVLLVLLLFEANRPVSRDRLSSALWGEHRPASAAASLSNHVVRLRRLLGDESGTRLRTIPTGYLLQVGEGELDAGEFARHLHAARAAYADHDWHEVSLHTTTALALWRGNPLTDVPVAGDELLPHVQSLLESRLQAMDWHAEAELQLGRHQGLIPDLSRTAEEYPLRESLHRHLMLALQRAGRKAEALAVYQRLRRTLVDELGIEPSSEVKDAHQEILADDTATPVPAIQRRPVPEQLPADISDFTGRDEQIAYLSGFLSPLREPTRSRAPAVCVVSGTGGIGKTTFAVHLAHRLAAEFPDGRIYINLRGTDAAPAVPADVLAGILRALGEPDATIPADEDGRAARYRTLTADRRLLIVLDDAADSAQVRPLLPGTGSCSVLVTSRHRLAGLASVTHVDLEILDDIQAQTLLCAIVGAERVGGEAEAAAAALSYCAGLPLAIRIAGARLATQPAWSITALAARLADERRRLDELRTEDVAVRATFQMGYQGLLLEAAPDYPPARAFRLLGLHLGPDISTPAAAALLGESPDRAEDVIGQLVGACMLDNPSPGRYRFHDLLRAYATECAELDEPFADRRAAVHRMALWYLGTVKIADRILAPGATQGETPLPQAGHPPLAFETYDQALRWCHDEGANLVAVAHAAAAFGLHEEAWLIPSLAWRYFRQCSRHREWFASIEIGLSSARVLGDRGGEVRLLNSQAGLLIQTRRFPEAEACLAAMARLSHELGDQVGELSAIGNRALVARYGGKFERARALSLEAVARARALNRPVAEANALSNLGRCADLLGDRAEALARHRASLEVWTGLGDQDGRMVALANIGATHLDDQDFPEALSRLQEALPLAVSLGNRLAEAEILTNLGRAVIALERLEEGREYLVQARVRWGSLQEAEADRVGALLDELDARIVAGG